jgi:hypothetical protein
MRKYVLAGAAALAIVSAGSILPNRADAMPAPAGLSAAVTDTALAEQTACRVFWNGFRMVRRCWFGGPVYGPRLGFYGRGYGWHRGWHRGFHRW